MAIGRRGFIAGLAGGLLLAPLEWAAAAGTPASAVRFLGARVDARGRYALTGLDVAGRVGFDVPLPGRGHGMAVSPDRRQAVLVARRPGNFLVLVDLTEGRIARQLQGHPDRHFYGHGVYSPDGRWLYTPENDFDARRGVIGVRDVQAGYRRVAELPAHGIGPHDIALLADGRTLVVANGGIHTHPDTGRAKLNLADMQPSLVYLDVADGRLLERHQPPPRWHRNSIRHLAVTGDDRVCLVTQYQGPKAHRPPLVGLHRRGEQVQWCRAPDGLRARMHNYCGSVCADGAGEVFAVSSPHGDLVTFWSARDGVLRDHTRVADGCGVAAAGPGRFLLSSGAGELLAYDLRDRSRRRLAPLQGPAARWDNHLSGLG